MDIPVLQDIVIIFGLAVLVLLICNLIRLPAIVGFLLTGIITGPHGLKLIDDVAAVEMLATLGIMLLLFTIGLEFSLKRLIKIKRFFFLGGIIQVALTVLIGLLVAQFLGRPIGESLFLGFLLSMSSTAIVIKALEKQDSIDSPQGHVSVGILIFQDLIAVPMMLLTPTLGSGTSSGFSFAVITQLLIGLCVLGISFFLALKVIPKILYFIAKVRSREIFLLSLITICTAIAWLASSIGLSLALGAFLGGLIIAESEYRHEAVGNILPLQDIFSSLFFVSTGMIVDIHFVMDHLFLILLITFGVMAMKCCVVAFTTWICGLPWRIMLLSGIALSQIGEFSFVLAKTGFTYQLGSEYNHQLFLAVALLSMAVSPSLINSSEWLVGLINKLPFPSSWKKGEQFSENKKKKLTGHVIIIGFGLTGRNLAKALKTIDKPYVIIEMNPVTVRDEQMVGEPILFGDATHQSVLNHVNIAEAVAVAVMINDPIASKQIVALARKLNPTNYIIIRTRYVHELNFLHSLGANDVVSDEFGSSIELLTRALQKFKIPEERIELFIDALREKDSLARKPIPL